MKGEQVSELTDSDLSDSDLSDPVSKKGGFTSWRLFLYVIPPLAIVTTAIYLYLDAGRLIETSNAYVKSDKATISAEVSGVISRVYVTDNQPVIKDELLFEVGNDMYRIELEQTEAEAAEVAVDLAATKLAYAEADSEIERYKTNVKFAASKLARQQELHSNKMGTVEELDFARHTLENAENELGVARKKAAQLLARLGGDADIALDQFAAYRTAMAAKRQAELNLQRTRVKAPFGGIVAYIPKPGDYITPGKPVMAIVADTGMWVEANFKETQLTYIKPGQHATVTIDAYPGVEWEAVVDSISEATGAEFALLPPQNATGNWVKIVQRIPIKISLREMTTSPLLRMGMSANVSIDTLHTRSWRDLLPD